MSDTIVNKLSSSTQVEVLKTSYTWTIHNFSFIGSSGRAKKIKSSTFALGANDEHRFRLRLYPHGSEEYGNKHVALFLQLVSPTQTPIHAKFDLGIIKPDGWKQILATHKLRSFTQWKSLGYHSLIERSQLLSEAAGFMSGDTLRILCDVSLSTGVIVHQPFTAEEPEEPELMRTETRLVYDMEALLRSKMYADAVLLVGNDRFKVHKALLSARSPVFAAMFEHDMKEKERGEVRILDVEKEVLEELIRFMYTGRVRNLAPVAHGLLAAADKYALNDLKHVCERYIFSKLTPDNVINTLVVADRHNSRTLKQQAIEFMKINAVRLVDKFTNFLLNTESDSSVGK